MMWTARRELDEARADQENYIVEASEFMVKFSHQKCNKQHENRRKLKKENCSTHSIIILLRKASGGVWKLEFFLASPFSGREKFVWHRDWDWKRRMKWKRLLTWEWKIRHDFSAPRTEKLLRPAKLRKKGGQLKSPRSHWWPNKSAQLCQRSSIMRCDTNWDKESDYEKFTMTIN